MPLLPIHEGSVRVPEKYHFLVIKKSPVVARYFLPCFLAFFHEQRAIQGIQEQQEVIKNNGKSLLVLSLTKPKGGTGDRHAGINLKINKESNPRFGLYC
jgi:hypothetical protein